MTFVILFVLAVAWAWYLLTWLSSRREHRNVNSISTFSKHLDVLERTSPARAGFSTVAIRSTRSSAVVTPGGPVGPVGGAAMTLSQAQIRRRNVLIALAALALGSLVPALVLGGAWIPLHVGIDVLLVGYVALLARSRRLAVEREQKVVVLHDEADWAAWEDEAWDDEDWADEQWHEDEAYASGSR